MYIVCNTYAVLHMHVQIVDTHRTSCSEKSLGKIKRRPKPNESDIRVQEVVNNSVCFDRLFHHCAY